jgi:hypothetical protein
LPFQQTALRYLSTEWLALNWLFNMNVDGSLYVLNIIVLVFPLLLDAVLLTLISTD